MELYIVRHGRTEWNAKGLIQGISDIPLLEEGREMARQTARGLKTVSLDAVYASPLSRAFETAEILVEGRNLEIRKDQRLREMDFGIYEGEDYVRDSELLRGFYEPTDSNISIILLRPFLFHCFSQSPCTPYNTAFPSPRPWRMSFWAKRRPRQSPGRARAYPSRRAAPHSGRNRRPGSIS